MSQVPEHIQIKLQNAEGYIPRIMELCLKEATCPRTGRLTTISVYLGEMTQALRNALNYAMWDFAETNLKSRLAAEEYKNVRWSHDFPIEKDKEDFKKSRSRILRHIDHDFPEVYQFLERAQPYHDTGTHLWYLKTISNDSAHRISVEAPLVQLNAVAFAGLKPSILGNQVVIPSHDGSYKAYPIPCFVYELKMFVSKEQKWVLFLIGIGDKRKPNLIPFIQTTSRMVHQLVSDFYALW
jgi:hypothetical protein